MLGYLHFSVATFERWVPRDVPEGTRFEVRAKEAREGAGSRALGANEGSAQEGPRFRHEGPRGAAQAPLGPIFLGPSRPYLFGGCLEDG